MKAFINHLKKQNQLNDDAFLEKKWLSHSFRVNYITDLWKRKKDIEFVKQIIVHANIQTTSSYVTHLSLEEKKLKYELKKNG